MARAFALLVAAMLLLVSGVGSAQEPGPDALWTRASQAIAAERAVDAIPLLEALAAEHPRHDLADDALFLAGSLCEEKLADPARAQRNYRALVQGYPDSRSALAAERRLESLDRALGDTGQYRELAAGFQDLLNGYPSRDLDESIRLADELLAVSEDWPGRGRLLLWLAETKRRAGLLQQALDHYDEALAMEVGESKSHALLGAAEVEILLGRFDAADARLATALPNESGAMGEARRDLQRRSAEARGRERNLLLARIGVGVVFAMLLAMLVHSSGGASGALQALWPPPTEPLFLLPVALLLSLMAITGHQEVGPAVVLMSVGSLVFTWLLGACLRARVPLQRGYAWACAGMCTVGALCLCYLALYRSQLLDLVITTVRFGPE